MTNFLSRCLKKDPKERASAAELEEDPWVVENKKATMRKYVSITNLPRFQVNAQESKKAAQKVRETLWGFAGALPQIFSFFFI